MKKEYDLSKLKSRPNPYASTIKATDRALFMTLNDLLPTVQQLSEVEKKELFRILRDELQIDKPLPESPDGAASSSISAEKNRKSFRDYAGIIEDAGSADNESIDADLAKAYANEY